jgi:hypothetical protein
MENGSGGYMGGTPSRYCHQAPGLMAFLDIVFNGGRYGMSVGNQQFTVRNITVNNANTAVQGFWNWGE